eukprot:362252_1
MLTDFLETSFSCVLIGNGFVSGPALRFFAGGRLAVNSGLIDLFLELDELFVLRSYDGSCTCLSFSGFVDKSTRGPFCGGGFGTISKSLSSSSFVGNDDMLSLISKASFWFISYNRSIMEPEAFPLLQQGQTDTETNQSSISDSWKWYHTVTILCIRLIIDFVFKNPLVFYLDYQQGLSMSYLQFAYILIAAECGCIFAIFIGDIQKKYIDSDLRLMQIYLVICGFVQILTPALTYFNVSEDQELYNLIWCCIMRFIVGISFAFISAASIKLASQYVSNPSKISSIISVLHYSWPLSTVLNVVAGYLILSSWMWVFVFSGIALIGVALFAVTMFHCFPLEVIPTPLTLSTVIQTEDARSEWQEMDRQNGLRVLFTDMNSLLIIFVSFFMTLRSRTIYIVTSSLWMEDTYGLSSAMLGWCTVSVVLGEVIGLGIMTAVSHKVPLWVSAVGTLTHQLVFGVLLLILALVYGNDMALSVALILIMALTMGHESFYVVQQTNAIFYAPLPRLQFLLLLAERMAQECGSIIALVGTVWVWQQMDTYSIVFFSLIWIVTTSIESVILFIYRTEPTISKV